MRNLTLLIVLMAAACGKKKDEQAPPVPAVEPTTDKVAPAEAPVAAAHDAAPVVPPVVDEAPEAPGAAAEQCTRILAKAWKAIQPGLAKLGVTDVATLEKELTETGYASRSFLEKCPAAPRAYRACIEAGENPLHFIGPCRDGLPEPKPDELPIPQIGAKPPLLAPVALPSGEAARIKASLVGTWESAGPFGVETWTIDKAGKVSVERVRDGKVQDRSSLDAFSLSFENVGQATVHYAGNDQTRSFFLAEDGKTLYTSGNLMWSVYPLGDGKTFVAKSGFDWVLVDGGVCEVVTFYGSVVPATCAFAERDGAKLFDVTYQIPGKVRWGTTDPEPTAYSFVVVGSNLLASELVKQEAFARK
jgi:hypothetical protein